MTDEGCPHFWLNRLAEPLSTVVGVGPLNRYRPCLVGSRNGRRLSEAVTYEAGYSALWMLDAQRSFVARMTERLVPRRRLLATGRYVGRLDP